MGILSFSHWIIVALVVFLLFGPGRISDIMGDLGGGIRSFRDGVTGAPLSDAAPAPPNTSPAEPE